MLKFKWDGSQQQTVTEGVERIRVGDQNKLLNEFLEKASESVRNVFHGRITYASLVWEAVDWSLFDVIGIDYYRSDKIKDSYIEMLKPYFAHKKPVFITEFGCRTYQGAEINGAGLGGNIIDLKSLFFHRLPIIGGLIKPKIIGKHVRDEELQARELVDQLSILDSVGVNGAFVSDFVSEISPFNDNPKYDIDMAGMSLVRSYEGGRHGTTYPDMTWDPKESFKAVADYYAAH